MTLSRRATTSYSNIVLQRHRESLIDYNLSKRERERESETMDWSKLYDDAASAGSNEDVLEDDEQEPSNYLYVPIVTSARYRRVTELGGREAGVCLSCTWCSSAKRENFSVFAFSCFNYVTQSI